MPRKVNYGVDYGDADDVYGDYTYDYADDYGYEVEETVPNIGAQQQIIRTGVWHCPICTYDNEDRMSACDICGVLRYPLAKDNSRNDNHTVGGISKNPEASMMAKSLFASWEHPRLVAAQNDDPSAENNLNFHKLGNARGDFHDFQGAFISQSTPKINIAVPFKFDSPSPDDLVSNGLRSLKLNSKANFGNSLSLDAVLSKRETEKPAESDLGAKAPELSSAPILSKKQTQGNDSDSASACQDNVKVSDGTSDIESSSSKSRKGEVLNEKKAAPISQYKPESWMIPNEADNEWSQLNLAIVGHVDSGKSTLSGRLLHLLGRISQKEMHKYEKEAKQKGKGSFAFAWAMDESAEERERGITMNVGVASFSSRKYHVVLLDSPGHRDFVPNMISGASQADAAILVVDASIGSFEAGIDSIGGQTREHAQLIRSFGVDQIIVAVNKMDVVDYSEERFSSVKQKLFTFLRSCGFKDSSILWVPVSAMENQNLVAKPSDIRLAWFSGPTLLEAIDSLYLPARDHSRPLLLPICDVTKSQSQSQVSVCGKLESGAIRTGIKVLVMPSREIATVRSLERDSRACNIARAGENVTVNLQNIEGNRVKTGGMICHPEYPVQVANRLELKILVLDISTPILIGSQLECHIHHAKEAATVVKILSLLDPKTGNTMKKFPRILLAKQNALVEVVLQGFVCVEEYSGCRALGRVSLRSLGRTVALGVVTQVIKTEE